jgi:transcriptional regulator with GAF, ATPase, and Fis domain
MAPAHTAALAPDRRGQEILLLGQVMRGVGQGLAPAVVLREMLHLMSELLGLNRGRIVLAQGEGSGPAASTIHHAYGLTAAETARGRYGPGEGITGRVLGSGQPVIVQDVCAEPAFLFRAVSRSRLPPDLRAFIALPIPVERRTIGVLACHPMRHRQLSDELAILRILATLAGQVLQLKDLLEGAARDHAGLGVSPPSPSEPRVPAAPDSSACVGPVREYWPANSHPEQALLAALARHRGNQSRAAQSLGMTPRQFGYRLRKLGCQAA